jgi:N-acetylmuramoyl-L-alanine amidase
MHPDGGTTQRRRPVVALAALCAVVALAAGSSAHAARRVVEKSLNLDIAFRVADRLAAAGVPVVMTRTADQTVSLDSRTVVANRRRVDAFVSIHNNGSRNRRAGGSEVYHQIRGGASRVLGEAIRSNLARSPGLPSDLRSRRGDHGDYYFVLRNTKMPAVIVEGAYVTNPREARMLASETFRQQLADSIAQGILEYQRSLVAQPLPDQIAPKRVRVAAVPAPARAAGEAVNAATVALAWQANRVASAYNLYRDGAFLGTVENSVEGLRQPGMLSFTDIWAAPGQRYRYEISAAAVVDGTSVESAPARLVVITPPISVALDPGHGGADPGAGGSY